MNETVNSRKKHIWANPYKILQTKRNMQYCLLDLLRSTVYFNSPALAIETYIIVWVE